MKDTFTTAQRFSIRKYSIGAASVLLGAVFLAQGQVASADQVTDSTDSVATEIVASSTVESPVLTVVEETPSQATPEKVIENIENVSTEKAVAETNTAPVEEVSVAAPKETEVTNTPKQTVGYAAAKTDQPMTAISTDTTRRRAPKNTRQAPEAFQDTARGLAKAGAVQAVPEQQPAVSVETNQVAKEGETGFLNARSSSAARGDDYPNRFKYSSTGIDDWRLYVRQCTSFTAYRLSSANGFELPPAYGNGGQWGYRAQREGYRVDKNPAIGSVAWWDDGGYGHVAWVSAIQGANVEIEEYNYNWSESYNRRTVSIASVSGFIHFKDLSGGQVTSVSTTTTSNQGVAQSGTYTFTKRSGIRAEANMSSPELAYYDAGQSVNYDRKVTENGYEWISYLSFAGNRRYIAIKEVAKPAPKQEVAKATTGTITIRNNNAQTGTFDIIISNVQHTKEIQAVVVPTWSDKDGQDDIKWYEATRQSDGTYKQTVKASDHKNSTGLYHAHLYYRQQDGSVVGVGTTTTTVNIQVTPQRQQPSIPSSGTYHFTGTVAVRPEARLSSAELAHYTAGMSVKYDRVLQSEGRTWISYIAGSGNRRYIAIN